MFGPGEPWPAAALAALAALVTMSPGCRETAPPGGEAAEARPVLATEPTQAARAEAHAHESPQPLWAAMPDLSGRDEDTAQTILALRQYALEHPDDGDIVGQLGRVYHANRVYDLARACYERAAVLSGEDLPWRYYLAVLWDQCGERPRAQAILEELASAPEPYPPVLIRLADMLLDQGRLDEAQGLYERFNALRPDEAAGYLGLARICRYRGRLEAAEQWARRALACSDRLAAAHQQLALIYRALGREEEAAFHQARARDLPDTFGYSDPFMVRVRDAKLSKGDILQRAKALAAYGRHHDAIVLLEPLVARYPDDPLLRNHLASSYFASGRMDDAARQLEQAVRLEPENGEAHARFAVALIGCGRLEEALEEAAAGVRLAPQSGLAHYALGWVQYRLALFSEAAESLQRSLDLDPSRDEACLMLAEVLLQQGRSADALPWFERAAKNIPHSPRPLLGLAQCLARLGRTDEARRAIERCVQRFPDFPPARQWLEHLRSTSRAPQGKAGSGNATPAGQEHRAEPGASGEP